MFPAIPAMDREQRIKAVCKHVVHVVDLAR